MALSVRSLTSVQGQKIQSILRRSKNRVAIRRAQVILLSDQGMRVKEIAESTLLHVEYVRKLIRRFNQEGLQLFEERSPKGRPIVFGEEIRAEIVEIALSPPALLGQPFTRWSLEKLCAYLLKTKVVKTISHETLRTILKDHRVSFQRTKTWKESNDPMFEQKKND